jgi:dephospho-CoA kinase
MSSNAARKHLLIGLTGGIGSGKSTVAALFEKLGVRIIDTDEISRSLTLSGGAAIAAIRATFGTDYIDASGALDRNKMRALVFSNPAEKERLEAILHPAIFDQVKHLAASPTNAAYTIAVIPLLFQVRGYQDWLQRTLLVDCPEETQIARTMQRSGLGRPEVLTIMAQQTPRAQRRALADDIIQNEGDLQTLSDQVTLLHSRYLTITTGSD